MCSSAVRSGYYTDSPCHRMASGISRGNRNVSWAPRADSSPSTPSPSSGRVPTHGTPEQRQSPQMYTSPSEHRLVETSPIPLAPSPDETKNSPCVASRSAQARRPAPPALSRDSEDPVSPDPPPPSGHGGRPRESQDPDPPSTVRPELGKYPGVRAGARSKGGASGGPADPGNLGLRLPAAVEEGRSQSSGKEDQAASTGIAMHHQPDGQEREVSWGETFKIEWLCTERVQFRRTRHLRNPWNHGREIKVSRDGTELEPGVGQQLVDAWSTLGELAGGDDAMCTPDLGRKRGAKSDPTSAESKGATEKPS